MTPGDFGIVAGSTLASFCAGLFKGKRTHNGNDQSHNGNGHVSSDWAKTVDGRLDDFNDLLKDLNQNITDLRIDLGAKR